MAFSTVMIVFVFILLLSQMLQNQHGGHSVNLLPKVSHSSPVREGRPQDRLVIVINRDGRVFLGLDQILPAQLTVAIKQAVSRGAERRIYIKADACTKYGNVVEVLDTVRSAGIQNITFFVAEKTAP